MDYSNYYFVLGKNTLLTGGEGGTSSQDDVSTTTGTPDDIGADAQNPGSNLLFIGAAYTVVIAALWFFMIRPQRKKEKQAKEMQEGIRPGDNIVTSGGLFGKVMDVGEDSFIVEFGTVRGVRVPVRKVDVIEVREPKLTPPAVK